MTENKLNRLKEVLSVPTCSRDESRMIRYLTELFESRGWDYSVDSHGNVYVTKGESENFPCFIAHTDTVHDVNENLRIKEYDHKGQVALTGFDRETNLPSGCGGDDKCGVYLALEMLDTLDNVKGAFFVSEEIGCLGSKHADSEFFSNVGYAIQYDSPEGNSLSSTLMGRYLFEGNEDFTDKVKQLILDHGIDKWANHPYTDAWQLMEKFDFCCMNLAAGYYRMHTDNEYVLVDDVQNSYELGLKIVETLGENKYLRGNKTYRSSYTNYYGSRGSYWSRGYWSKGKFHKYDDNTPEQGDGDDNDTITPVNGPKLLSQDNQLDAERAKALYTKPLMEWTDDDWDFYESYDEEKRWDDYYDDAPWYGYN